ncbi:hypothetical protein FE782_30385 [Paenibacillus antri]|uniref:Uncharacterized protein n=1 Tax=Paenibacillus antri TaxID=2582848 RepID=A0A5R9G4L4_9BACL|nr:hypothetical protein [Paenibacillus antri]TLS48448.1 hypothetical protein FE782_30385 [Paenibacillus antri]
MIFVLSLVVPFLTVSAMAIGTGYYQLHTEWKTNSIYLLLSLPIRGWKVVTAKLAAVLSLLLLTILCIGVSFALILLRLKWGEISVSEEWPEVVPALLNLTLNSFWMYCLTVTLLILIIQFAYLCGQLVGKFKWAVTLAAGFAALYLVFRVSPILSSLLSWMPELFYGGVDFDALYLHSGPFLVLMLLCGAFLWLNGYIFEQEVEV